MRFRFLFGGPEGILYGVSGNGDLLWFKSSLSGGDFSWLHWLDNAQSPSLPGSHVPSDGFHPDSGRVIGSGWNEFTW
jgi:hypothetical protein